MFCLSLYEVFLTFIFHSWHNRQRDKGTKLEAESGFDLPDDVELLEHKLGIIAGKWNAKWESYAKNKFPDGQQDDRKCNRR